MSYNGPPSARPLHRPRSLLVLSLLLLSLLLPATTAASSSSSSQPTLRIGQDEYDVANQQVLIHTRRRILPRSQRSSWFSKRASDPFSQFEEAVDFYNPNTYPGGQVLSIIPGNTTIGLGEPMNIIISGRSSKSVLDPVGLLLWSTSIDFGISCLGQSDGTQQLANLGDGRINQTQGNGSGANGVLRYNYGSPYLGTCRETFEGGNHFRWWRQNGTSADSRAYFLASSMEQPLAEYHMVSQNGYNNGRDYIVGNATNPDGTEWEGNRYNTTVIWIPAGLLLNATSEGINHPSVALPGQPAQDGRVAVLTITQLAGSNTLAVESAAGRGYEASYLFVAVAFAIAATLAMVSL